ncbi:MAG: tetratricopeptide repeat protein [Elusimicrobia bacterium]|nr:tetratricopeptide repeat protein [Candidatus Liberimonas magnetica]
MNAKIIFIFIPLFFALCFLEASVIKETEELGQLLEAGRFEAAAVKIENIREPYEKYFWKSRLSFYTGKYRDAYAEIESALGYTEAPKWWEQLKNYYYFVSEITNDFQDFKSEHFRLRAKGQDIILASYALDALEKAYTEIGRELNCYPGSKVLVEIYGNKRDFSLASTLSEDILDKTGTVGICKFNRLMILSPQITPLGYSWLDTLAHEYTHMLANSKSCTKCPLWLNEGIARFYETRWRAKEPEYLSASAEQKLKEAKDKDLFIPFARMSPSLVYLKSQDEILLAFAEVSSAVDFMRKEYGDDVVEKLLTNLDLSGEKEAFKKTFGVSLKQFEKKCFAYIKSRQYRENPGVIIDEVNMKKTAEDEFVGTNARGYIRLGDKMREIERFDAALIQYNKALELEPANPVILLKIAKAFLKLGQKDDAREKLKLAIEKNPHYVTPYQVLGQLYFENGDIDNCIEVSNKAIGINPFYPLTHKYLYKCYMAKNDMPNAYREIKTALILDPSDAETKVIADRLK